MNRWVAIYRFAWGLLIVLFAIGLACIFAPRFHSIHELRRRKTALQEENREIEAKIRDLRQKQDRFSSDPAFVELTARRISMVKPGETMVRLTNPPPHTSP